MLARLDEMKPPPRVEVDHSGTWMRVTPGSDAGRVLSDLRGSGLKAEELTQAEAASAIAAATSWYDRATIVELSREEFRTLARRSTGQVVQDAQLTPDQGRRLVGSLDGALGDALASLPPEGGHTPEWTSAKLKARDRVLEEAASYLQPSQLSELREALAWALR